MMAASGFQFVVLQRERYLRLVAGAKVCASLGFFQIRSIALVIGQAGAEKEAISEGFRVAAKEAPADDGGTVGSGCGAMRLTWPKSSLNVSSPRRVPTSVQCLESPA